jgi:NAD(P)-dependent dehydrogenase (short-subunit alcohol dehydrogenase family)
MTKTWLIPAGSGNLTRALAEAVLDDGGQLVLAGTSPADLAECADLPADRLRMVALDATDPGSAAAAVDAAVEAFGRLDVVVTSPAAGARAPLADPVDEVRARLEDELLGAVALTQAALPVFRRQGAGSFLHLASPGGPVGESGAAVTVAARRAIGGYLEALREEVAALGIRVTLAQPGAVPGDPYRTARVLADLVEMAHPPLRLALGSDALRRVRQSARARLAETDVWADVSRSTDRPGAPVRRSPGLAPVLHMTVPA